jgi:hypothetical protein
MTSHRLEDAVNLPDVIQSQINNDLHRFGGPEGEVHYRQDVLAVLDGGAPVIHSPSGVAPSDNRPWNICAEFDRGSRVASAIILADRSSFDASGQCLNAYI